MYFHNVIAMVKMRLVNLRLQSSVLITSDYSDFENSRQISIFENVFYLQKEAIESGKITVNGKPVKADYMVKNSDFIENLVHR